MTEGDRIRAGVSSGANTSNALRSLGRPHARIKGNSDSVVPEHAGKSSGRRRLLVSYADPICRHFVASEAGGSDDG